jgi:outer membrane biosynthesis protein TonB
LTSYQFTGAYPTFYPDERNAEGKSLMAEPGMVVPFAGLPPSDGKWIPVAYVGEAGPELVSFPPADPEPVPVVVPEVPAEPVPVEPEPTPEPEPVAPAPEPAPVAPELPEPAPEPVSEPEPVVVQAEPEPASVPFPLPAPPALGYASPFARA